MTATRSLLALFVFSIIGTAGELLLMKHYESVWMIVPLALFGLALVLLSVNGAVPASVWTLVFRALMLLFILSGGVGTLLHYRGKSEFARERDRTLAGWALARETVFKGANPPLLAPGAMIALGLLGLIWAGTATVKPKGES